MILQSLNTFKKAKCNLYWYNDDNDSIYLEGLNVDESIRNKKLGTILLKLCDLIGIVLCFKNIYLWVEKDSWMYNWYKRIGYSYFSNHEQDNYVWMIKSLKNSQ